MTPIAQWLNTTFEAFDYAILEFFHELALAAGPILTPIANIFDLLGEVSWFTVVIGIALLLFSNTRKGGMSMIFSVLIGTLFTNILIKNFVARPRPYVSGYEAWWETVGSPTQSEFSFPSGHATAVVATMLALCLFLCLDVKKHRLLLVPVLLYTAVMCASRNYLMVHYPTDVLGGIIIGGISAIIGYYSATAVFKAFEDHADRGFCSFMLDSDIRSFFR